MKKIIAINAGPRKGWNTDQLIGSAAKGAEEAGAQVEKIDLFSLGKFTGCVSCFGCKREPSFGRCVCRDGLSYALEAIRGSDGLIIGSPNYLGNMTASFRALYERLVFQVLTYNKERRCCSERMIPVLLIMTSNCAESIYDEVGYADLLDGYKKTLGAFVGPTEILSCGDTLQVDDYSLYDWTMFDPEAKKARRDETFGSYLQRAFEMGRAMI